MPSITAIKPQKTKNRVNVYLDNKFGFGLDLETFVISQIKVGNVYSNDEINNLINEGQYRNTINRLIAFCTMRPRSEKEIYDWLQRKKVPSESHEKVFDKLKSLELLNDLNFANWWIDQRESFRPRSKRQLEFELHNKGISKQVIDEIFSKKMPDDVSHASRLIAQRDYKWRNLGKLEAKKKKTEYLARKGFSWETIKKVV
ncbi:RecX family transcriptional regulator [Candidatus Woesebacteria bacterium]|nr:MAG: RecX family transcriptional regulator [Candidatus Woesebacteria bacterium]